MFNRLNKKFSKNSKVFQNELNEIGLKLKSLNPSEQLIYIGELIKQGEN